MKPISQLKLYKNASTTKALLESFLKLTNNPKRHVRGPLFSPIPGNGKKDQFNDIPPRESQAVSACATGILMLLADPSNTRPLFEAELLLTKAARELYPNEYGFISVSDDLGLRAIRKVVKKALTYSSYG